MNKDQLMAALQREVTLPDLRSWMHGIVGRAVRTVGLPRQFFQVADFASEVATPSDGALRLIEYKPDDALEFELSLPRKLEVSIPEIVKNNFVVCTPFRESEVYWQIADEKFFPEGRRVRISYIPRNEFQRIAQLAKTKGVSVDGFAFDRKRAPVLQTSIFDLLKRWLWLHRNGLGVSAAMLIIAAAVQVVFVRLDHDIARHRSEVSRLASELRRSPPPEIAPELLALLATRDVTEARKAVKFIEANLGADASIKLFRWRPGEITIELGSNDADALVARLRRHVGEVKAVPADGPGQTRLTLSSPRAAP